MILVFSSFLPVCADDIPVRGEHKIAVSQRSDGTIWITVGMTSVVLVHGRVLGHIAFLAFLLQNVPPLQYREEIE